MKIINKKKIKFNILIIYTVLILTIICLDVRIHTIKVGYESKISNMKFTYENNLKSINKNASVYKELYTNNEKDILKTSRDLSTTKKDFAAYKNTVASAKTKEQTVSRGESYNIKNFAPITATEVNNWIKSKADPGSPFIGKGNIFIEAANESGLDPKFIISLAALESGWGKSQIAKDKNNYFGIAAYNASPEVSAKVFDGGLKEGIIGGAKFIATNFSNNDYISVDSMQSGNKIYSQNSDGTANQSWSMQLISIMN